MINLEPVIDNITDFSSSSFPSYSRDIKRDIAKLMKKLYSLTEEEIIILKGAGTVFKGIVSLPVVGVTLGDLNGYDYMDVSYRSITFYNKEARAFVSNEEGPIPEEATRNTIFRDTYESFLISTRPIYLAESDRVVTAVELFSYIELYEDYIQKAILSHKIGHKSAAKDWLDLAMETKVNTDNMLCELDKKFGDSEYQNKYHIKHD